MTTSDEPGGSIVDAIELALQFEIDTASVSLGDLAAIRPGHVVALQVPVDRALVRLRCEGREVGTGQLIVIGQHLGVRIDRIAWSSNVADQ